MFVTRNVRFLRQLIGVVGVLTFGLTAQAQIFTGSIDFLGNATLNAPLGSATAFTSISGFVSGGQTGDFSSVPDYTPAIFTPFTFSPPPMAGFPFVNFTVDSANYVFEITSISPASSQSSDSLDLMGSGYILAFEGNNFNYSPATWTLDSLGVSGELITYGASINSVPEPSAFSFLLIGGLLLGGRMLFKRRRV